jgi:hypothetical protein
MYFAKVKSFNAQKGEMNGLLILKSGAEIFFQFSDGEFICAGDTIPVFSGKTTTVKNGKSYRLKDPKPGDEIVVGSIDFHKAAPWGYKAEYDIRMKQIADCIGKPTYRCLMRIKRKGISETAPSLRVWHGDDLDLLRLNYPLPTSVDPNFPSEDKLVAYVSGTDLDGEPFEINRWFEVRTINGWIRCNDPR